MTGCCIIAKHMYWQHENKAPTVIYLCMITTIALVTLILGWFCAYFCWPNISLTKEVMFSVALVLFVCLSVSNITHKGMNRLQ